MLGIVYGIVQSSALFAFHSLTGNQVTDVNNITEFAKLTGGLAALEETFGFFV